MKLYRIAKALDNIETYESFKLSYNIDRTFRVNGECILFYGEGDIICGKNSYLGSYSTVQANKNFRVVIGEGCSINHDIRVYTQSNDADEDFSIKPIKEKYGDVIIGNNDWIGANVFINPGISIGDNAVIGANSVVTKNVEEYTVVGGVPARLIRKKKLPIVS